MLRQYYAVRFLLQKGKQTMIWILQRQIICFTFHQIFQHQSFIMLYHRAREKGKIRFPNFFTRDQESRAKTCSMWVRDTTSHPKALLLQVICFRQIRDFRDAIFSSACFLGQGVQKLMSKALLILQKVESQFHSDFLSRFRPHLNQILFRLVFNASLWLSSAEDCQTFPFSRRKTIRGRNLSFATKRQETMRATEYGKLFTK